MDTKMKINNINTIRSIVFIDDDMEEFQVQFIQEIQITKWID